MAPSEATFRNESQTALIVSLAVLFVSLSTIAVLLRLYTRSRYLNTLGADDISITTAQSLAIALSVSTILEVAWGLGRHTQFVPTEHVLKQAKSLFASTLIYHAAQILTQVSFLILYLRLFPGRHIQQLCTWSIILVAVWGLAQEFLVGFSCVPLVKFAPEMIDKCISTVPIWYLTSSVNITTNFLIFAIPIAPVVRLQMGLKKKGMLLGLFCLGLFTCIISLVRLTALRKGIHTRNPFWDNAPTAYWSVIELNCGIMCACLPTLHPLIYQLVPQSASRHRTIAKTDSAMGHKLKKIQNKNKQPDLETGIYVKKEVEMHSTTELKTSLEYPHSLEDTASQRTEVTAQYGYQGN